MNIPDEFEIEWRYRYHERIGILCEDRVPTKEEKQIAKSESDEWLETALFESS